jgi:hypothetical protein
MFQEKVQSVATRACWNVPRESQEGSIKSLRFGKSKRKLREWQQERVGMFQAKVRGVESGACWN